MEYRLMRQKDTYNPSISEASANTLLQKGFVKWTNPAEPNVIYIRNYKIVNGKPANLKKVG